MRIIPYLVASARGEDSPDTLTFDSALLPHLYLLLGDPTITWIADEYQGIRDTDCMTFNNVIAYTAPNLIDASALVLRLKPNPSSAIIAGAITKNTILTRNSADNGGYSLEVEVLFRDYYEDPPDSQTDGANTTLDVAAIHDAVTGERIAAIRANLTPGAIYTWVEVVDSAGTPRAGPSTIHQIGYPLSMKMTVEGRMHTLDVNGMTEQFLAPSVFPDSGETTVKLLKMTEHEFSLVQEVDFYKVRLAKL